MFIKLKPSTEIGDKKIRIKFLLFPRIANDKFAWLEYVKLTYEYDYLDYDCVFKGWELIDIIPLKERVRDEKTRKI